MHFCAPVFGESAAPRENAAPGILETVGINPIPNSSSAEWKRERVPDLLCSENAWESIRGERKLQGRNPVKVAEGDGGGRGGPSIPSPLFPRWDCAASTDGRRR